MWTNNITLMNWLLPMSNITQASYVSKICSRTHGVTHVAVGGFRRSNNIGWGYTVILNPIWVINITLCTHPILKDLWLSRMCRRVSKRCPDGVWMTLDTAWMIIMPNQLLKLQWRDIECCFNWLVPFRSLTLDWPLSFIFWGVCRQCYYVARLKTGSPV